MSILKTEYKVVESNNRKTVVFNNLYFINGEFVFNGSVSDSEIAVYPNVHYRNTNCKTWVPKITELQTDGEALLIKTPHFYFKETLQYHPGHTLMDDIFSVFYSIYRCELDYNPFVCIVETFDNKAKHPYECKGMFKLLFGHEAIPFCHLKNMHQQVCFEAFVVGTGESGLSSYNHNYASPFEDNIWKQFRDAFYKQAEIKLEPGNKAVYINTTKINYLEDELNDMLRKNNIHVLCWGKISDIKKQLNVLKNVNVYITTDGSVSLNAIFLPDNATVINLGRVYAHENYQTIGYSEDYLFPSLPYIDVLYFEDYYSVMIKNNIPMPNPNDLVEMIKAAKQKENNPLLMKRKNIYEKFASKVVGAINYELKLDNFSPNARLLFENYQDTKERFEVIENFKRGNVAFACNEKVREFKTPTDGYIEDLNN